MPSESPSDEPSNAPSLSSLPSSLPTLYPSTSLEPSQLPSFSPVPGCSGSNDGYNVCVDPSLVGEARNGEIDDFDRSSTGEALDLCQGQCISDSQCRGRLVCVESEGDGSGIFKVRGCNKNAQKNWKYCVYPAFSNVIPVDDEKNLLANVKQSFMRVENNGTLSVYNADTNTRLWNNEDMGGTESDRHLDIQLTLEQQQNI